MTEDINSELVYTAISKKFGPIGYLVIDRLIDGHSFGGVRIVSDITLSELQSVARSMTYKNAFIGSRIGGAKAAVLINKNNEEYKKEILIEFGKSISPFVLNKMYFPVMDMGISIDELQLIFDSTGHKYNVLSWKNISHQYTAFSCYLSTISSLEKKGIPIKDVTFSVQGFGNVGCTYSKLMCDSGARLVSFSNRHCGIIDENGFDIDELLKEKSNKGDDFILTQPKNKHVPHDSVIEKEATVLLPAANALAINEENYKNIKADIIICAANAPMSYDIERLLFKNGKIVTTDFVANCGGILGSIMDNYVSTDVIFSILSTYYKKKIDNLLNQSTVSDKPIVDIVIDEVEKRINMNYGDIYVSKGIVEQITDILNQIIKLKYNKFTNNILSKKYMSRYEMLWNYG